MGNNREYIHICEVCGRREILTPEEGYEKGWDYPPSTCSFGSIAPRKCEGKTVAELPLKHLITLCRISEEPECITVGDYRL